MKQICVLLASPRKSGNTEALTMHFVEHMRKYDVNCTIYNLYNMDSSLQTLSTGLEYL